MLHRTSARRTPRPTNEGGPTPPTYRCCQQYILLSIVFDDPRRECVSYEYPHRNGNRTVALCGIRLARLRRMSLAQDGGYKRDQAVEACCRIYQVRARRSTRQSITMYFEYVQTRGPRCLYPLAPAAAADVPISFDNPLSHLLIIPVYSMQYPSSFALVATAPEYSSSRVFMVCTSISTSPLITSSAHARDSQQLPR